MCFIFIFAFLWAIFMSGNTEKIEIQFWLIKTMLAK